MRRILLLYRYRGQGIIEALLDGAGSCQEAVLALIRPSVVCPAREEQVQLVSHADQGTQRQRARQRRRGGLLALVRRYLQEADILIGQIHVHLFARLPVRVQRLVFHQVQRLGGFFIGPHRQGPGHRPFFLARGLFHALAGGQGGRAQHHQYDRLFHYSAT